MPSMRQRSYGQWVIKGDLYVHGQIRFTSDTYLLRATTTGSASGTAAGIVPGPVRKKLKVLIDGVPMYFLAASDWVNANSSSRSPSASISPSASPSS
jgi:hypothetical protein